MLKTESVILANQTNAQNSKCEVQSTSYKRKKIEQTKRKEVNNVFLVTENKDFVTVCL